VYALGKQLRAVEPDLVHLHGGLLWSNASALLLKREPWIQHVHMYPDSITGLKGAALRAINRRLCDAYVSISCSVTRVLRDRVDMHRTPIYTIHNGIPVHEPPIDRPPNAPGAPVYGMASRLAPDKGLFEFVDVAEAILELSPGARFVLAGDGPLATSVRQLIRSKRLEPAFSLPGHIVDIDRFWRTLDVALFTGPREPLGLRILEPMAAGVPVATYLTGYGSDELIRDGVTGIQVPWGNASMMARRVVELTADIALWRRISAAAAKDVREHFSLVEMCNRLQRVYEAHARGEQARHVTEEAIG
jgi:glycosyltransferase involved in cell wall biosynthesis